MGKLATPDSVLSKREAVSLLPQVRLGNQVAFRAFLRSAGYHQAIEMGMTPAEALDLVNQPEVLNAECEVVEV